MSLTPSNGGTSVVTCTQPYHAWQSTISPSQVTTSSLSNVNVLLIIGLATSVDIERLFSRGRLILSHVRSRLSSQSTRALLCLGAWSRLGYVNAEDAVSVSKLPDVTAGDEGMEEGRDIITID